MMNERKPNFAVFYEWCVENAPRVVEMCPYKFPVSSGPGRRFVMTDVQKLSAAIGRVREIGRFRDGPQREPIVVSTSHGDTGLRYVIAQENEESLVLTTNELRWLVNEMFGDPDPIPEWRFWFSNLRWRLGRRWRR